MRLNRRASLVAVPLVVLLIAGVLGTQRWREWRAMGALPAGRAGTPNVLLLVLDTVRSFSMSVYGHTQPTTPTLERLASEGVLFNRAFATSGWTLPSHASMFTGRYADELDTGPGKPLPTGIPTLAEAMTSAGYATGGFVANLAYATWEQGLARGFIRYEDYPATPLTLFVSTALGRKLFNAPKVRHFVGYVDDVDRKNAAHVQRDFLRWLGTIGDRPFFAFINYFDAHHPYLPPAPYDTLFGPQLPRRYRPYPPRFQSFDAEEIGRLSNAYHGAIAYIDDQIDQLLDALEERGTLDNTLIIVTSDHGEHLGDHDLLSHGNSFYRQLLQVPLILWYPALLPSDSIIATSVSLRDLPATVLDVTGIPNGDRFPGVSLVPVVHDTAARTSPIVSGRTLIRVEGAQSLISDGMHYIRYADETEELYDLERDSLETQSLVSTSAGAALLPTLRARLDSLNAAVPPVSP
jgi:arylsulfatase A-like enzyme